MEFEGESRLNVVQEYRDKYRAISDLLDANPKVLGLVHQDVARLSSSNPRGRESDFSSEQLLRALIVMTVEHTDYRDTVVRIENSDFLRHFVRLAYGQATMDFTFLNRAHSAISEATWEAINGVLSGYAVAEKKIDGEKCRLDTTVVEANIHYPTDSSLLWDGFRTLARLLGAVQREHSALELDHRFHTRKVKKLAYFIARNAKSRSSRTQGKVTRAYRTLIERVTWIVGVAEATQKHAGRFAVALVEIGHYLPLVKRVIDQTQRRVFGGETVPAAEKLYSLFEPHTELLIRGKAGKPVEFGHKVLLAQTGEKFIHHYQVLPVRKEDPDLLAPALRAHEKLFGRPPKVLSTDKGFYESMEQIAALEQTIPVVSMAKKGRRTADQTARESTEAFKDGQRFRAGCEGSISVLKRAFKLGKCLFKGFRHYAASVGLAVFCHNLVLLARG
jgi:IS5 family transposase